MNDGGIYRIKALGLIALLAAVLVVSISRRKRRLAQLITPGHPLYLSTQTTIAALPQEVQAYLRLTCTKGPTSLDRATLWQVQEALQPHVHSFQAQWDIIYFLSRSESAA